MVTAALAAAMTATSEIVHGEEEEEDKDGGIWCCWCCVEYSFEEEWETCGGKLSHVEAKSGGTRESKAPMTPIIMDCLPQ